MSARRLQLGPQLALPAEEAQTQTFVVYGGKGMGKTNLAAVFVEELAGAGLRFSLLDPVGVSWGLKHSADGRGAGVEVLILGGLHGDLPIEPTAGAVVADLVVDEAVSVIVDVSRRADGRMWTNGEKIRFVRDYCTQLYLRQGEQRRPLMQVIDEAGRFVPQTIQKGSLDVAECMGAIEQLVEWGRNVGVGVALITQRSARMNKSVSELAEVMIAFRTVGPNSVAAIIDWFGEHVEKQRQRELVEQLRELDVGAALVVSPGWLRLEGRYAMRPRATFDSSATPRAGQERHARGRGAQVDVAHYRERMAETVERAEAEDPRVLRTKLANLELELAAARRAVHDEVREVEVERVVEVVPVAVLSAINQAEHSLASIGMAASALAESIDASSERIQAALADARAGARTDGGARTSQTSRPAPIAQAPAPARPAPSPGGDSARIALRDDAPTAPEQKLLNALRWWQIIGFARPSRLQVAMIAGYHVRTKGFLNALGSARTAGWLDHGGGGGDMWLTTEGEVLARTDGGGPTTREELHGRVLAKLTPATQRVLAPLLASYPDGVERDRLAEELGYHPRTKGFLNQLGRLHNLGFARASRGVEYATDVLFP